MDDLNLGFDEGIILQAKNVYWIATRKCRLSKMVLTNKSIILMYPHSSLFDYTNYDPIISRPLSDIKRIDGRPLVEQISTSLHGTVLQIQFAQGIEQFLFDLPRKKTTDIWMYEIKKLLSEKKPRTSTSTKKSTPQEESNQKAISSNKQPTKPCPNCGLKLSPHTKFCPECGTQIKRGSKEFQPEERDLTYTDTRQQKYVGIILKCPACGANISQTTAICPECGQQIVGHSSIGSVEAFHRQMQEIESQRKPPTNDPYAYAVVDPAEHKKLALISSFPIPNTIDDVLEFMFLTISNIDVNLSKNTRSNRIKRKLSEGINPNITMPRKLSDAWVAKMRQAYQKAKVLFPNDKTFETIEKLYLDMIEKLNLNP